MPSLELKDKTQKTSFDGTEWVFIQNSSDPFLVQKISLSDLRSATGDVVGSSIKTYATLIPISSTFPWLCLSYPSVNLTTTNYSTEFIDALRARKYIYNEFSDPLLSPRAESFSGAWASNVFTLANTPENVAMITELAEDWLYHGSLTSNWRILRSNNQDYNITGITVATRQITVNIDGSATSGASIEIFTNRVYRQATQARHFSEAGLATYQAGGGKSGRLFRRDQMQLLAGSLDGSLTSGIVYNTFDGGGQASGVFSKGATKANGYQSSPEDGATVNFLSSGSPNARTSATTGGETIAKSSSRYEYIYVGSYTA